MTTEPAWANPSVAGGAQEIKCGMNAMINAKRENFDIFEHFRSSTRSMSQVFDLEMAPMDLVCPPGASGTRLGSILGHPIFSISPYLRLEAQS